MPTKLGGEGRCTPPLTRSQPRGRASASAAARPASASVGFGPEAIHRHVSCGRGNAYRHTFQVFAGLDLAAKAGPAGVTGARGGAAQQWSREMAAAGGRAEEGRNERGGKGERKVDGRGFAGLQALNRGLGWECTKRGRDRAKGALGTRAVYRAWRGRGRRRGVMGRRGGMWGPDCCPRWVARSRHRQAGRWMQPADRMLRAPRCRPHDATPRGRVPSFGCRPRAPCCLACEWRWRCRLPAVGRAACGLLLLVVGC